MRLTVVLIVMLAGATMTTGKPLILTKKFLRYVLPTLTAKVAGLSGLSGLTGLTGLSGKTGAKKNGIGSVVLPNRVYSFLFPRDSLNPPASVVYHSLDESCLHPPPPPLPLPVPVPPPSPFPLPHDITVAQSYTQYGPPPPPPPPLPVDAVYIAQTPSAIHEAPLPGHTSSVTSVNTGSASGIAPHP
ncbi:uncharacterized protein LOC135707733 [Ochlerotatus camptorhynchus]|uniref:uncharacterized protein LOC135707733 n=1 Tax=Ochlerotatus camptorhynchus TaxID=644619 RepID=UPI0031D89E9F